MRLRTKSEQIDGDKHRNMTGDLRYNQLINRGNHQNESTTHEIDTEDLLLDDPSQVVEIKAKKAIATPKKLTEKEEFITEGEHQYRTEYHLCSFEELPPFLQDNHFIHKGYRANFTPSLCAKTIFCHHNETLCIWTHLLATVLFFVLMIATQFYLLDNPGPVDRLVFMAFLVVAQLQMGFSTIFHTFGCCSPDHYKSLAKLDYAGISVMIVGSYYPPLYYGFTCHETWRTIYMVTITLLGVVGLCVSCINIFSTPPYRIARMSFFLVFGFFAVFPIPHMVILNGWEYTWPILWRELIMGALYTVGAGIYGSRYPERAFPGKFDFGLSSHVIWHFFTIAAALVQFWTCFVCYNRRIEFPCKL